MKLKLKLKLPILVLCVGFGFSGVGFASGGDSAGGGGYGSYSTSSSTYDRGKMLVYSRLICADCPLGELELDRETAKTLLPRLKSKGDLGKSLRFRERYAIRTFLKRRYKL